MSKALLKMAEGYELLAAGIRELAEADTAPAKVEKKQEKKPVKEADSTSEETVSIETVRAVLAEKSRDGKTQEVRKLLNEFGADKLSAIPADKMADLLKKAEVL